MLKKPQIEEIIRRYKKGQIPNRIAIEMNITDGTVVSYLRKNNLYDGKTRKASQPTLPKTEPKTHTPIREFLETVYYLSPRGIKVMQTVKISVFRTRGFSNRTFPYPKCHDSRPFDMDSQSNLYKRSWI